MIFETETGKWTGPIRSAFGLHLVQVTNRIDSKLPDLGDVVEQVKRDWMIDRQNELKNALYAKIRERYSVTVETRSVPIASAPSVSGTVQ
jgi:parvulin-like peptidyl-prolyl isomerase